MSEWETFCDNSYFDLWRVRRKNERGFDDGYHLQHGAEAKELVELLNRLERERDEAREQLRKASVEANTLATSIQKAEYPDAKEFELLGSVAGVISQIDNMYAGLRQQRDEATRSLEKERIAINYFIKRGMRERDEAREEIKELIYIAERAIALAEIDFENDKFGVVSELRDGVERIKERAK